MVGLVEGNAGRRASSARSTVSMNSGVHKVVVASVASSA